MWFFVLLYHNSEMQNSKKHTFNAGFGGLALGILGTTLVMLPKLKKRKEEESA